jgi:murein DD-endopeptidase MepM/ murein hydrolase activator NlpD
MTALLLAGGCSADVERLSSTSFDSGYNAAQADQTASIAPARAAAPAVAANARRSRVASAEGGAGSKGYLQVAKVDLAPLDARPEQKRVQTADGYGIYNKRPLNDGVYDGPRVVTPYDRPYAGNTIVNPPDGDIVLDEGPGGPKGGRYDPPPPPYGRGGHGGYGGHDDAYESGRGDPYAGRRGGPRDDGPGEAYDEGRDGPYGGSDRPYDGGSRSAYHGKRGGPDYGHGRPGPGPSDEAYDEPDLPRHGDHSEHAGAYPKGAGTTVKVAPGDTLFAIAIRNGTTVHALIEANGLRDDVIRVGQEILIPGAGPVAYAATDDSQKYLKPLGRQQRPQVTQEPRCEATGQCHVVRAGESLTSIAKEHGVAAIDILDANGLTDPRQIKPGNILSLPRQKAEAEETTPRKQRNGRTEYAAREETATARDGVYRGARNDANNAAEPAKGKSAPAAAPDKVATAAPSPGLAPAAPVEAASDKSCEAALANPLPRSGKTFREPVEGLVIAKFGAQADGGVNEGINISVPKGTPVKAAENGVVAYVGNELSGFGNLILIRHADDYVTAYAHADQVLVHRCDVVKRGEVIAKAGATGDVAQPQLHFEIRKASKPVDPASLL